MYNALTMVIGMVKECFHIKLLFWCFYKQKIIACLDDLSSGMFSMPSLLLFCDWKRSSIKLNVSGFELSEWEENDRFMLWKKSRDAYLHQVLQNELTLSSNLSLTEE